MEMSDTELEMLNELMAQQRRTMAQQRALVQTNLQARLKDANTVGELNYFIVSFGAVAGHDEHDDDCDDDCPVFQARSKIVKLEREGAAKLRGALPWISSYSSTVRLAEAVEVGDVLGQSRMMEIPGMHYPAIYKTHYSVVDVTFVPAGPSDNDYSKVRLELRVTNTDESTATFEYDDNESLQVYRPLGVMKR